MFHIVDNPGYLLGDEAILQQKARAVSPHQMCPQPPWLQVYTDCSYLSQENAVNLKPFLSLDIPLKTFASFWSQLDLRVP